MQDALSFEQCENCAETFPLFRERKRGQAVLCAKCTAEVGRHRRKQKAERLCNPPPPKPDPFYRCPTCDALGIIGPPPMQCPTCKGAGMWFKDTLLSQGGSPMTDAARSFLGVNKPGGKRRHAPSRLGALVADINRLVK